MAWKISQWFVGLIIAAGVIGYLVGPIAKWYMGQVPALGVDFYNSVTNVALLQRHFAWWWYGFKDTSFGGFPVARDFPPFAYYTMLPFAHVWGVARGVQMYVMFVLGMLTFCCFGLYWQLSKNWGIALAMAGLVLLSANIYGSAMWGGSLPYFGTQFMLPLVVWLVVRHMETENYRWLVGAAILAGWGFLAHPLVMAAYVFPVCGLVLGLYPEKQTGWKFGRRFAKLAIFGLGVYGVGFVLLYKYLLLAVTSILAKGVSIGGGGASVGAIAQESVDTMSGQIAQFYRNQITTMFTDTNRWLEVLVGVSLVAGLVGVIAQRNLKAVGRVTVWFLIASYVVVHVVANLTGHYFLFQGLYRAFWAVPVVMGALVAVLWGTWFGVETRKWKWVQVTLAVIVGVSMLAVTGLEWWTNTPKVLDMVWKRSDTSSAFPEILSMNVDAKANLLPSFMSNSDKTHRLYTSDATLNIWWNSKYEIPLARGYTDPPIGASQRAGVFLLDTTISNDTAVRELKFPVQIATNVAKFLVDWDAIGYYEGGHVSQTANTPPSSYLVGEGGIFDDKEEVKSQGAILRYQTVNGRPEARFDLTQSLYYYKVKDQFTTPVVMAANAPAILVLADYVGYEQVWRAIAGLGWTSRQVVMVNGSYVMENLDKEDLKGFGAVIVHNYKFRNPGSAWDILGNFVKEGGKVWVETGTEVRETQGTNLPKWWPVAGLTRGELTGNWQIETGAGWEGVDVGASGQPLFNGLPWKFSYSTTGTVSEGSTVELKQNGKIVMASRKYGSGLVVWSGINLPYYVNQNYNVAAEEIIKKVFGRLVQIQDTSLGRLKSDVQTPGRVVLTNLEGAKAILVKMGDYEGWRTNAGRIWGAGPFYPGYVYINGIASNTRQVKLTYWGENDAWFEAVVTLGSTVLLAEYVILGGGLWGKHVVRGGKMAWRKSTSWWEKEEAA